MKGGNSFSSQTVQFYKYAMQTGSGLVIFLFCLLLLLNRCVIIFMYIYDIHDIHLNLKEHFFVG